MQDEEFLRFDSPGAIRRVSAIKVKQVRTRVVTECRPETLSLKGQQNDRQRSGARELVDANLKAKGSRGDTQEPNNFAETNAK